MICTIGKFVYVTEVHDPRKFCFLDRNEIHTLFFIQIYINMVYELIRL